MQANHIKSNKNTMPSTKPNLKGYIKAKSRSGLKYVFFQMLQILEELGKERCKFLIYYALSIYLQTIRVVHTTCGYCRVLYFTILLLTRLQ